MSPPPSLPTPPSVSHSPPAVVILYLPSPIGASSGVTSLGQNLTPCRGGVGVLSRFNNLMQERRDLIGFTFAGPVAIASAKDPEDRIDGGYMGRRGTGARILPLLSP